MTATPAVTSGTDPVFERLEDQIAWYDGKSSSNQKTFRHIKVAEIVAAALIPFLTPLRMSGFEFKYVVGLLGVVITALEGLLHLNQYQQNWITYRATCEALKHEKFLYLGKAGPYATATDAHALLAERTESLVSQEHAKWASIQQRADSGQSNRNE